MGPSRPGAGFAKAPMGGAPPGVEGGASSTRRRAGRVEGQGMAQGTIERATPRFLRFHARFPLPTWGKRRSTHHNGAYRNMRPIRSTAGQSPLRSTDPPADAAPERADANSPMAGRVRMRQYSTPNCHHLRHFVKQSFPVEWGCFNSKSWRANIVYIL